jgi:crotonobetainyl-CoA:carnitine CoA-transferase CaiB-like acyl-CoA transferase
MLQAAGIAAAPTLNPADVPSDEHLVAREFFGAIACLGGGERLAPRVPWRVNGLRPAQLRRPPQVGEDTERVLRDVLGYDVAELARLADEGITF